MFLFNFLGLEIDFKTIIAFIIGIVIGLILFLILFVIFALISLGSKKIKLKNVEENVYLDEIKELIYQAQKEYKDNSLRGNISKNKYLYNISNDLIYLIATKFYPNSKNPLLELSLNDTFILIDNIKIRLEEVLDRRGVRILKKFKVSTYLDVIFKNNNLTKNKDINKNKENKKKLNVLNPAWWVRKSVIDNALQIIFNKFYLIIIAIVGEETYKIFINKTKDETKLIDTNSETNVNELLSSINEDLASIKSNMDVETEEIVDYSSLKFKQKYINISDVKNDYETIFDENFKFKERR